MVQAKGIRKKGVDGIQEGPRVKTLGSLEGRQEELIEEGDKETW